LQTFSWRNSLNPDLHSRVLVLFLALNKPQFYAHPNPPCSSDGFLAALGSGRQYGNFAAAAL
jgi:hypothetical protein